jgi:sugar/nucleoside kinase (ribokinase family)
VSRRGLPDDPPTILVIGDVMLDIIAAPQAPIVQASDTPAEITLLPGGSGANQAAWLAHLGSAAIFVGRAGHTTQAEHVAALRAHGVEPLIAADPTARTGTLVTLIGANGERSFLTDRGANARLERADVPAALLDRIDHIHVSGYALVSPGPRAAVRDFLASALARGVPFSVDVGSIGFLRAIGGDAFLDWTRGAAVCFANADEAALIAGGADVDEQCARLGAAYPTAVITRGAAGARAVCGGEAWSVAAPAATAVDTSGAGDAFVAGFLTTKLRGAGIVESLQAGVRAGTAAVTGYGGRPRPAFAHE